MQLSTSVINKCILKNEKINKKKEVKEYGKDYSWC